MAVLQLHELPAAAGPPTVTTRGRSVVTGHHGEILQGMFIDCDGRPRRGLLTLPCPLFFSRAVFVLDPVERLGPRIQVVPDNKWKAARAAALALDRLRCRSGGSLTIESNSIEGWGLGSSTADVTAAILAVCDALNAPLPPAEIAELAVRSEQAIDPLMFRSEVVLFAHREGRILEAFDKPIPRLAVLGFNPQPQNPPVDTLQLEPARYDAREIRAFEALRAKLRRAVEAQDLGLLGEVATGSAIINQRYVPLAAFDLVLGIAQAAGAVGVQVAHSGCVAGILFDARAAGCADALADAQSRLARQLPHHRRWVFETGGDVPTVSEFAHDPAS